MSIVKYPRSNCVRLLAVLIVIVIVMSVCWAGVSMAGSSIRLNDPLLEGETLYDHFVSPSGDRVIYRLRGLNEQLYSVPVYGGDPVLISQHKTGNGWYEGPLFSSDGNHVVFEVPIHNMGNFEVDIYSVPVDGGIPVKITPDIATSRDVRDVSVVSSPTGDIVIWRSDIEARRSLSIYSAPMAGGETVKFSAPLLADETQVSDYKYYSITPDGKHLVYLTDIQSSFSRNRLYTVDLQDYSVNSLFDGEIGNYSYKTSADSNWIIVKSNQDPRLYSLNFNDNIPIALTDIESLTWISKDSSHVIYSTPRGASNGYYDILSIPITGGTPVLLSGPNGTGGTLTLSIEQFDTTSDGATAVYAVNKYAGGANNYFHLYSTSVSDGNPIHLNPTIGSGSDFGDHGQFWIHPNGSKVLFINSYFGVANKLYSVGIHGGPVIDVIPTVEGDWLDTRIHAFTPGMDFVLFRKTNDAGEFERSQLYAASIDGGKAVPIGDLLAAESLAYNGLSVTSDGKTVIYKTQTGQSYPYGYNLYSTGFPLAKVTQGQAISGDVGGTIGAPGRVDFQFDNVTEGNTFSSVFSRLTAEERDAKNLDDMNFLLPGDVAQVWDMDFAGQYDGLVTLMLTYDASLLDEAYFESALEIYHQNAAGVWELLPILSRDIDANTITVQTQSFSNFALGVPEPVTSCLLSIGGILLITRRHAT